MVQTYWTPLHFSAAIGHLEVSRLLLEARSDVNATTAVSTSLSDQLLHGNAVQPRSRKLLSLSLPQDLWTPLHFAFVNGHVEVSRLLLRAGAAVEARNKVGSCSSRARV